MSSNEGHPVARRARLVSRKVIRGFVPKRLTAAREKAGMSRGDLARVSDVTETAIGRWETGARSPQIDHLAKVVRALGLQMSDLVIVPSEGRYPGDWRVLLGLTQPELGKKAGISTTMVGAIERGEARLTEDVAAKLSAALGIPGGELRESYERARSRPPGTPA